MSFIETRLSECVSAGFQVVPAYSTRIVALDNGQEKRNVNWTKARRRFSCDWRNFTREDFEDLLACFHVCAGSAHSFRFKDWTDYEATDESLGTTPGANQTPVQLIKTYTFGGSTRTRNITKPVSATVYQGGVAKAGTLDTTTGLFTPTTSWTAATALTWTGTFDVPVRFVSDEFPATFEATQNYITATAELIEDFV
jgi:uncharacterized protein (TIGR02217 family)